MHNIKVKQTFTRGGTELSKKIKKPRNYCATVFLHLTVVAIFVLSLVSLFPQDLNAEKKVTKQTCSECHDEQVAAFINNPHAGKEAKCIDCHTGGDKHLEEGGKETIFSFKESDTANSKSAKCIKCHQNSTGMYFASSHGKASLDCTACHKVHMKEAKPGLVKHGGTKS